MYHPVLEDISDNLFRRASRRLSINGSVRFTPWRPRKEETALLRKHRKRKGYTSANYNKSVSTVGLRGLINLGNTCFMSCIVQTLVHTPLLRDYFLSGKFSLYCLKVRLIVRITFTILMKVWPNFILLSLKIDISVYLTPEETTLEMEAMLQKNNVLFAKWRDYFR